MRTTRLRTRRDRQTVSWSEKTLPEVGRLRNHFRFGEVEQFDCHPEQAFFAWREPAPCLPRVSAKLARLHLACPERATATEGRVWLASFAPLL
jgi:hypothetical protein